ncbi:haloacid dehalogenase [Spirochaetia bacterium]|nr:haloacid dehalogenase [Spirochaetia bacterium]
MAKIRLIALDLDDTLLRSDLTISQRTRKAIKKAINSGIIIVLASGRVRPALTSYVKVLGLDKSEGYLICGNGAIIHDTATGKIIEQVMLPSKPALAAYHLADAEGFSVQLYVDDVLYVSKATEYTEIDRKLTGLKQVIPENFAHYVETNCHKLVIPGDPMLLKPLETILRNVLGDELTLFTSKPYFLEILPPKIDKGIALAKVATKLGIDRSEVMSFGDSMNDEAMILWAEYGIAMLNGDERIKELAWAVTEATNDNDGIAIAIERYCFS